MVKFALQKGLFKGSFGKKKQQQPSRQNNAGPEEATELSTMSRDIPQMALEAKEATEPSTTSTEVPKMALPPNERPRQATVDALQIVHTSQNDPQYNILATLVRIPTTSWHFAGVYTLNGRSMGMGGRAYSNVRYQMQDFHPLNSRVGHFCMLFLPCRFHCMQS